MMSAFRARRDQLAQHFRAAARTRRRLRIAHDDLGPSPRRRHVPGLPCGQSQNLTGTVPERAIWSGCGFEPLQDFRIWRGVDQQQTGPHRREVLDDLAGAIVRGDRIVSRDCGFAVRPRELGGFTQTGQHAVSARAIGRKLGKCRRCLLMLARFRERDRLLKRCAGLRRLLGLPPLVTTPGADPDDDHDAGRNEITAVALPQLFELFAADFLINFMEYVGHAIALKASPQNGPAAERFFRPGSNRLLSSRSAIRSIRVNVFTEALDGTSVMLWREQGKMRLQAAVCSGLSPLTPGMDPCRAREAW